MAVTLTVTQLAEAIRVGTTAEETAQVTRLLAVATQLVTDFTDTAPDVLHNEAVVRIAGYLYDAPTTAYGAALTNSGAAALLIKYRAQRAGRIDGAVAGSPSAGGTVPGVDADLRDDLEGGNEGQVLVKRTDADLEFEWIDAGNVGGKTDARARAAAAAAQASADTGILDAAAAKAAADAAQVVAVQRGVDPGGSTGQVLAKKSNTDFDTRWIDAPSGGGNGNGGGSNVPGRDDEARRLAGVAQTTAESAQTTADTAKSTADAAKTTADTAKSTADAASRKADAAVAAKTAADNAQAAAVLAQKRNPPAGGEKGQFLAKSADTDYQYAWRSGVSQEIVGRVEALQHVTADLVATDLDKWVTAGDAASASVAVVDTQTLSSSIIGNAVYAGSLMQPNGGWEGNWILLRVNKAFPIADLRLRLLDTDNDHFYYYGSNDFLSQSAIRDEAGIAYYSVTLVPGSPSGPLGPALGSITVQKHLTRETEYTGTVTGSGSVPAGGAKDQVLAKKSATDYDAGWVTPAGGGGLSVGNLVFEATRNATTRSRAEITDATNRAAAITGIKGGGWFRLSVDRSGTNEPPYGVSPLFYLPVIASSQNIDMYVALINVNRSNPLYAVRIVASGASFYCELRRMRAGTNEYADAVNWPTDSVPAVKLYKIG